MAERGSDWCASWRCQIALHLTQIDPRFADGRFVRGDARLRLLSGGVGIVVILPADGVDRDQIR
jgi:hypothetical protein